jgi:hypothetical protein
VAGLQTRDLDPTSSTLKTISTAVDGFGLQER